MIAAKEKAADRAGIVSWLPIEKIDPHPLNPRQWPDDELDGLAASLEAFGMIQPITVRAATTEGRYQLVAGERRYRAAKKAKLTTIRAVVRACSDAEALLLMLTENVERRDLNPIQKARLLAKICAPVAEGGLGKSKTEVAALFGHDHCWASNLLSLLRLPEAWTRRVEAGDVAETQARTLVKLVDRPQVLTAVERDYSANRWAWRTREDFERNVERLARDPSDVEVRPPRPTFEDEPRDTGGPTAVEASKPATISREMKPAAATFAEALAFVRSCNEREDLERITEAARKRIRLLRQQRRRQVQSA